MRWPSRTLCAAPSLTVCQRSSLNARWTLPYSGPPRRRPPGPGRSARVILLVAGCVIVGVVATGELARHVRPADHRGSVWLIRRAILPLVRELRIEISRSSSGLSRDGLGGASGSRRLTRATLPPDAGAHTAERDLGQTTRSVRSSMRLFGEHTSYPSHRQADRAIEVASMTWCRRQSAGGCVARCRAGNAPGTDARWRGGDCCPDLARQSRGRQVQRAGPPLQVEVQSGHQVFAAAAGVEHRRASPDTAAMDEQQRLVSGASPTLASLRVRRCEAVSPGRSLGCARPRCRSARAVPHRGPHRELASD
jgi:hypothetical protein